MAEEKQFHEYPKSMHHHVSGEHVVVKSEAEELALGSDYINGHEYWRGVIAKSEADAQASTGVYDASLGPVPSEHAAAGKPAKPTKKAPKPKTKKQPKEAAEPVEGQQ